MSSRGNSNRLFQGGKDHNKRKATVRENCTPGTAELSGAAPPAGLGLGQSQNAKKDGRAVQDIGNLMQQADRRPAFFK